MNHNINNSLSNESVLGVVLAGGLSSRMGQDKAQLQRDNVGSSLSMLDFSKQLLIDSGISNIVISGDNHQVADRIKNTGPVGGIHSVLQYCLSKQTQPKALLILPVDLPLMTSAMLSELRLKGELSQKATFFKETSGKEHYIPLYLPNNAYLELFLANTFKAISSQSHSPQSSSRQGEPLQVAPLQGKSAQKSGKNGPSIRALLQHIPHQSINATGSVLFNSNTPQEWQQAKQYF